MKTETSLNGHDLDAMRKRLRFRNTVSEVSRSRSELSEDDGRELINKTKLLNAVEIIGGKRLHKKKNLMEYRVETTFPFSTTDIKRITPWS